MEEKKFDEWINLKKKLHNNSKMPRFSEREVWWCSFGENVGVEINGKSARFTRPVLVFKKFSKFGFLGVPLTSQKHEGSWYAKFDFANKTQYASLTQIRMISVSRLQEKIGRVSKTDFETVKTAFFDLYK